MRTGQHRRSFLKAGLAAAASGLVPAAARSAQVSGAGQPASPIPKRTLGRTGQQVTIYGLGGLFTVSRHDRHEQAVEIVNRAIDLGVNYIDTAPWYGNGASELNIGTVLRKRRAEVFLASKSHNYTYDGTMALVEQSLKRLETDRLDLYQHHFLGKLGTLEQLRQKNSARQAFERLRDQGVIRFIGVTAHSARVLADALEDYPYDCALITLNPARAVMDDPQDLERFFRLAQEKNVGVIAMKVFSRGALVKQGFTAEQLLRYVWSYPVATAVVGISELPHLEENVRIARAFKPLSEEEKARIRAIAAK
ncbi:MAG: aldo/keto reductase [Bryobacterales bacterium]|nr:aldo/keto reductase [Bryobacteraceae bacterium]MDW8131249.1 aldo/keto reductase [Bryobacterales bacterium]